MLMPFRRSLLLRLGLSMAAIAGLALFGIISSVVIAELLRGQATAINQAGALRMQTYLIGTRLLDHVGDPVAQRTRIEAAIAKFDQRVTAEGLTGVLPQSGEAPIRLAYTRILDDWRGHIRPLLLRHAESLLAGSPPPTEGLTASLDGFVELVDRFVLLLEQDTEAKIHYLRLTQGVSLFLTLVVIYVTMYLMHTEVLTPLRGLLTAAERARRGDFTAHIDHTGEDELGQLGSAFNVMTADLSRMYAELEDRVRHKTAELEQSNRSLELLYNTLAHLSEPALSTEHYVKSLSEIERFLGVGPSNVCLIEPDSGKGFRMATSLIVVPSGDDYCVQPDCRACLSDGKTFLSTRSGIDRPVARILNVPLKDRERIHGILMVQIPDNKSLEPWQIQLIEAVGRHIGIAIGSQQRLAQDRRLTLLEERGAIARELHDSLAQSLSYLKIQVARLQALLGCADSAEEQAQVMDELREGLNSAYRELRELITTFRLKMDGRGFATALEETVRDFAERGGIAIELNNRLADGQLSVNEEIHVLQITREALANVVQHAEAKHAWVTLTTSSGNHVTLTIADDGIGVGAVHEKTHHYGLTIMRERAQYLGGELSLLPRAEGGTRVILNFLRHESRHESAEHQRRGHET